MIYFFRCEWLEAKTHEAEAKTHEAEAEAEATTHEAEAEARFFGLEAKIFLHHFSHNPLLQINKKLQF